MSGRSVAFLSRAAGLRPRSTLAGGALLLALASLLLFALLPRYTPIGGQRLANPELAMAAGEAVPRGWTRIGRGGEIAREARALRITARSRREKVGLYQILTRPEDARAMRIRGRMAVPELDALRGEYRGARLIAAALRDTGPYRFNGRPVARFFAPAPMASYALDVPVPDKRRQVGVAVLMSAARGSVLVERLELFWLREYPAFTVARSALGGAWGLWLLLAGRRFLQTAHRPWAAGLLLAGLALVLLLEMLPARAVLEGDFFWLRPVGGFLAGLLAALARERDPVWRRAVLVLSLVAAVELAQLFGPGLGPDDVEDFGAGAAGALAGLSVAGLLRRLRPSG